MLKNEDGYIQVGVTALRDPATGGFLPEVPLYVKADEDTEEDVQDLITDLENLFRIRMEMYVNATQPPHVVPAEMETAYAER